LSAAARVGAGAQERLEPVAKDATVFGYKLHYLEAGRGEPIILLHGSGGEGARWMPTIQGLATSFRVIALDQIGFGQVRQAAHDLSQRRIRRLSVAIHEDDWHAESRHHGSIHGGRCCPLSGGCNHPEMVERLVLVDGRRLPLGHRDARAAAPQLHNRQIANAGTLEESREYLEKLYYDHSFVTDKLVESRISCCACARPIRPKACKRRATGGSAG